MRKPTRRHSAWTLDLGRVLGIEIRIHATFLLLLAWIALGHLLDGDALWTTFEGLLLIVVVFAIVVLHELAHALVARRFGVRTRDITLLPIGGVSSLERIPDNPRQELLIALAGPSVNVVLALALFGLGGGLFFVRLAFINVGLAVFNLLPAFPLDGGRVLRALLALRLDYDRATQIAARVGKAMALVLGVFGLFSNPMLVLVAIFVWLGAQQEAGMVHLRSALGGVPVHTAMRTRFIVLSPSDPLTNAAQLGLAGFQSEFPVIDGGRLVGVLRRHALPSAIARYGAGAPVSVAMSSDVGVVAAGDSVESALEKLAAGRTLFVTDRGAVVGMLTAEGLAELMAVEEAMHATPQKT